MSELLDLINQKQIFPNNGKTILYEMIDGNKLSAFEIAKSNGFIVIKLDSSAVNECIESIFNSNPDVV